nr:hypothetical protein [Lachnospiraceae bacterium]
GRSSAFASNDDSIMKFEETDVETENQEECDELDDFNGRYIIRFLLGDSTVTMKDYFDINKSGEVNLQDVLDCDRLLEYGEDYVKVIEARGEASDNSPAADDASQDDSKDVENIEDEDSKEPKESEDAKESRMVYADVSNSGWTECYIYSWEQGEQLTKMEKVGNDAHVFAASLPEGVNEFLFINNDKKEWGNSNQTDNVNFVESGYIYTFSNSNGEKYSGSWSKYED